MQRLNPKAYAESTEEPVTLEELKMHARIDSNDEDLILWLYAKACRRSLEKMLGISMNITTWDEYLDCFPEDGCPIKLTKAPLIDVLSFSYTNLSGSTTTLVEGTDYVVDPISNQVALKYGATYPTDQAIQPSPIRIRYRAGYGIKEDLKLALILMFTSTYENRSASTDYEVYDVPVPVGLKQILTNNTVWGF